MTEYMMSVLRDYINALTKAERIIKDNEHDAWMLEGSDSTLYEISLSSREQLMKVRDELSQSLLDAENEANKNE